MSDAERIIQAVNPVGCAKRQASVRWIPAAWEPKVNLEHVPQDFLQDGEINRSALLELGREEFQSLEAVIGFFISAMAWGYGRSPRGPWRVSEMLQTERAGEKLLRVIELVRREGAIPAYLALSDKNKARISWLGPSFGTKLLYFAGYHSGFRPRPLILDRLVGRALDDLKIFLHYNLWNVDHYARYLSMAEDVANHFACDPDDVECWLFLRGRRRTSI